MFKRIIISCLILSLSGPLYSQDYSKGPDPVGMQRQKQNARSVYDRNSYLYFYGFPSPSNPEYSNREFRSASEIESIGDNITSNLRFNFYVLKLSITEKSDKASITSRFAEIPQEIRGTNNTVVLVFSGHGDINGDYYFIASDSKKNNLQSTAISGEQIRALVLEIANKGNRVLLFLDTCFSGKLLKSDFSGITSRYGGIAVFSSSSEKERSFESIGYGGSKYSQAIAYALNGENSDAADINNNITIKSLHAFLCKKVSGLEQHPQMNTFGNLSQDDIILKQVSNIIDYKDIVERYSSICQSISKCIKNNDFINALHLTQEANGLSIESEDRSNLYSIRTVSTQYYDYLKTQDISSIERHEIIISNNFNLVDNSIINKGTLLNVKGERQEQLGKHLSALSYYLEAYNYPTSRDADNLSRILSSIKDNASFPKAQRNEYVSNTLLSNILSIYPEIILLPDYDANSFAKFICNYIYLNGAEPDIKKTAYNMVASMDLEKEGRLYQAEAMMYQGDVKRAQNLIRSVILKNEYKRIQDLHYSDFIIQDGRHYELFLETLPDMTSKRISIEKKRAQNAAGIMDVLIEPFYDDLVIGLSLTSDFNMYPIGIKGDVFWGIFHVGIDANIGSSTFYTEAYAITNSTSTIKVNGQTIEPTVELVNSGEEKTRGVFSFTITPGLFYKYVSLDCGLGKVWTKTTRIDTYKYTYGTSSSTGGGGTTITTLTSTDTSGNKLVEAKNDYFAIKPGLSGIIPMRDNMSIVLGAHYRICPKNREMNGFECSIGVAFHFD